MAPELGALVAGVQTGRVPSAVCSLARLRLLKMKGQSVTNIKKRPAHTQKRENQYINLKYGGQQSKNKKKIKKTKIPGQPTQVRRLQQKRKKLFK